MMFLYFGSLFACQPDTEVETQKTPTKHMDKESLVMVQDKVTYSFVLKKILLTSSITFAQIRQELADLSR